jgi:hypothetical protein
MARRVVTRPAGSEADSENFITGEVERGEEARREILASLPELSKEERGRAEKILEKIWSYLKLTEEEDDRRVVYWDSRIGSPLPVLLRYFVGVGEEKPSDSEEFFKLMKLAKVKEKDIRRGNSGSSDEDETTTPAPEKEEEIKKKKC